MLITPAKVVPLPAPAPVTVSVVAVPEPKALPSTRLLPVTPERDAIEGVTLVNFAIAPLAGSESPPVLELELPSAELVAAIRVPLITVVKPV